MKKILSAAVAFCMLFCMFNFSASAEEPQEIKIESMQATTKAIVLRFNREVQFDYDEASEKYKNVIIKDSENTVFNVENITMSEDNKTAVIKLEIPFSLTEGQQTRYTLSIPYLYSKDGTAICFGTEIEATFDIYWLDDFESYETADDLDDNYRVIKNDSFGTALPSSYTSDGQLSIVEADGNKRLKVAFTSNHGLWIKKFAQWNQSNKYYTFEGDFEIIPTTNNYGIQLGTQYTSINGNYKNIGISPAEGITFPKKVMDGLSNVPATSELNAGTKFTFGFTSAKVDDSTESFAIYLNGAEKTSATGKLRNDAYGIFTILGCGFGSQYYLDNWRMYSITVNQTNGQTYALPKMENVVITGEFEENSDISCSYTENVNYEGPYSVNDEYQWFKGDNCFAEFPGDSWTELTQAEGNKCKLSADDINSYVVCRVIKSIDVPVGDEMVKVVLNDEKSHPIAKPSVPVCYNPEIKYEHTELKDTLAFTYEYFDANMDEENGTVILWEESTDEKVWTASSLTPTVTKDGSKTKSEIDVTDITDKYFRCSVTVKNEEPNFGDKAETVTLSYKMPFKPVANNITVSGKAKIGSILTANYDYFDANGDEEVESEIMWIRKDASGNETVVSQKSYSYLVQKADSGCSIAFAVIPKSNTFPTEGDKKYSTFLSVPVYEESTHSGGGSSSGGSSGGGSYYVGYKDISVSDENTNTNNKPTTGVAFTDIEGHWAYNEIKALSDKGYIKGKSQNTYAPEDKITRAEWLTLLLRCADIDTDSEYNNCFNDVGNDDWYAKTVQKAYELGFISGDSGNFYANDVVTREQMAKMIIAVYEYKTQKTAVALSLDAFSDNSDLSKWAEEYMEKAVGMEFIKGVTEDSLSPLSHVTRAQSAVILLRFINKL